MLRLLISAFVVVVVVNAKSIDDLKVNQAWEEFKVTYNRQYENSAEEPDRYAIFSKRFEWIQRHNFEYERGIHTYKVGVNQFADRKEEEIKALTNCYKHGEPTDAPIFDGTDEENIPSSVDWRAKGAVTPVKDQGHCGSCWAFSSTGAIEGVYKIKGNKLKSFSEQQLVDCVYLQGGGCKGGWMPKAFKYVKMVGGIEVEAAYPYTAEEGRCRFNKSKIAASLKGHVNVKKGSEIALTKAIAKNPVSVAIDTSGNFHFYKSGVYRNPNCSPKTPSHAVLAVGYGTKKVYGQEQPYYLVKNSWATNWGQDGYILMSRNNNDNCGIASWATYPLM